MSDPGTTYFKGQVDKYSPVVKEGQVAAEKVQAANSALQILAKINITSQEAEQLVIFTQQAL